MARNISGEGAYRLVGVADSLGHTIAYTLDASGHRTEEAVRDSGGVLRRRLRSEYDALGRLARTLDAAGQAYAFAYDKVGNRVSESAPAVLGRPATGLAYDAFDRLVQATDPEGGIVKYEYDARDRLSRVIDPRSLATVYGHDGLGNETSLASPDTGTTTHGLYDEAGNRRQSTDARGRTVTHGYDALDRLSSSTWAGEAIAYAWDQGPHGIGRLSSITDASGTTQYAYDAAGRVIADTRVISGVTLATAYAYDTAGRLSRITYPSGRQVSYAYDGAGRISGVSLTAGGTTTALASSITYSPFGGITGLALGPGSLAYTRTYDLDGRVTSYKLGTITFSLTYDAAGNVTRLADPAVPAQDRVFAYDKADRLLSLTTSPATLNQGFTYDKVGNRLSRTVNGVATAYTPAAASNRLSAVGGVTRSYDASGNQTGDGTRTFAYDDRGRLTGATTPLGPVTYALNALGQRVRKTVGTVTTVYAYDLNGHLLGEYDGTGTAIQEIAWLGDTPIAAMRAGTSGTDLFPIWTDHLDTPRLVTNTSGTARWEWPNTDPFGANLPNDNPAGLGAFQFNLRFPGQLHDPETGTHYNYYRDFDPSIGRYVQSDPIGLRGGLNTFRYGYNAPLTYIDPLGLSANCTVLATLNGSWTSPTVIGSSSSTGEWSLSLVHVFLAQGRPNKRFGFPGLPGAGVNCYAVFTKNITETFSRNRPVQTLEHCLELDCGRPYSHFVVRTRTEEEIFTKTRMSIEDNASATFHIDAAAEILGQIQCLAWLKGLR